jgi:hypothetical protein
MRTRRVGLVAGLALLAGACGASEPLAEATGPSVGIAVHGDWTIHVLDANGSLDRQVTFENALESTGQTALVELLAGARSAGDWYLEFGENEDPALVCPSAFEGRCVASAEVEMVASGGSGPVDTLRLTGAAAVEESGQIELVRSVSRRCVASVAPVDCVDQGSLAVFTSKLLGSADAVPVAAGQSVQVQVDISFTTD